MPRPSAKKCIPHTLGVHPEAKPFYYQWCCKCREKAAAGLVRTDAGPYVKPKRMAVYTFMKRPKLSRLEALAAAAERRKRYDGDEPLHQAGDARSSTDRALPGRS